MASISPDNFVAIYAVRGSLGSVIVEMVPKKREQYWQNELNAHLMKPGVNFRGRWRLIVEPTDGGKVVAIDHQRESFHLLPRKFTFALWLAARRDRISPVQWELLVN